MGKNCGNNVYLHSQSTKLTNCGLIQAHAHQAP